MNMFVHVNTTFMYSPSTHFCCSQECDFVTVAHDASPTGVLNFMADQWSLEEVGRPNLIVSVLAGAEASR